MNWAKFDNKNKKRDKKHARKHAMQVDGAGMKRIQVALANRLLDLKVKSA